MKIKTFSQSKNAGKPAGAKTDCRGSPAGKNAGCMICGKPLVYRAKSEPMACGICRQVSLANAVCEDGHYVCDACHICAGSEILRFLAASREKDPLALLEAVFRQPPVHLHGPEHHGIVPCVLLTAYHNCGGALDLPAALAEAWKRGGRVPGGVCGNWGVCGAAAGAGIFASVVAGSNPLNAAVWHLPQQLAAKCLEGIAACGGPRCCKRTSRTAVETAAAFAKAHFGVDMPCARGPCGYFEKNRECILDRCPYYGIEQER